MIKPGLAGRWLEREYRGLKIQGKGWLWSRWNRKGGGFAEEKVRVILKSLAAGTR